MTLTLTERMWEISRLDREIEALKAPPRKVIPMHKPVLNPEVTRLQCERKNHATIIRNSKT